MFSHIEKILRPLLFAVTIFTQLKRYIPGIIEIIKYKYARAQFNVSIISKTLLLIPYSFKALRDIPFYLAKIANIKCPLKLLSRTRATNHVTIVKTSTNNSEISYQLLGSTNGKDIGKQRRMIPCKIFSRPSS